MQFAKGNVKHEFMFRGQEIFSGILASIQSGERTANQESSYPKKRIAREADCLRFYAALTNPFIQKQLAVELMADLPIDSPNAYQLVSKTLNVLRRDPFVQAWTVAALVEAQTLQLSLRREIVAEIVDKSLLGPEIETELLNSQIRLSLEIMDDVIVDIFDLLVGVVLENASQ
jgi:hypothetical protein